MFLFNYILMFYRQLFVEGPDWSVFMINPDQMTRFNSLSLRIVEINRSACTVGASFEAYNHAAIIFLSCHRSTIDD